MVLFERGSDKETIHFAEDAGLRSTKDSPVLARPARHDRGSLVSPSQITELISGLISHSPQALELKDLPKR